ncbi:MAG: YgiQ family radical SAM protein [Lentimicrobiaceae bacterium]|nr:YgiQ family radical SAM protein [Lentimicrobiaceae bacterium]
MNIPEKRPITDWLPVSREELDRRGWDEVDVIIVSGDAYVDHPSFGHAVMGRLIEKEGFRVAVLPQPNWRDDLRDFKKLGKPRLFFGVTAGCMDSMVNHYTANKRLRSDDAYTPGGIAGFRPDYASVVYTGILKKLFPDVPVILGGIEASMRRLTHYDYWSDSLKPDILTWSGADMLVFGMGEKAIVALLQRLAAGEPIHQIRDLEQTAFKVPADELLPEMPGVNTLELPSHVQCKADKKAFARHFRIFEEESNRWQGARLIEPNGDTVTVINPANPPMEEKEIDAAFDLPYTRQPHPRYNKRGQIPAFEMIRNSINLHRGCFGGCAFCAISAHQGKFVVSRSEKSIMNEVKLVASEPDFKGHITDMGGPSANMYLMKGIDTDKCKKCKRASCIFPTICRNLNTDHRPMTALYKKAMLVQGVKRITIGSGIRYDMLVGRTEAENKANGLDEYLKQVITKHVSGRLKVAPEHSAQNVLQIMRKPHYRTFIDFQKRFEEINRQNGLKQQLIPYFISSHPGSRPEDMAELACETMQQGFRLEQVQDFTPTPMTLATAIYYTGIDPYTQKPVYVAKTKEDKVNQQRFFFWYKAENKRWLSDTLRKMGRKDLLDKFGKTKRY